MGGQGISTLASHLCVGGWRLKPRLQGDCGRPDSFLRRLGGCATRWFWFGYCVLHTCGLDRGGFTDGSIDELGPTAIGWAGWRGHSHTLALRGATKEAQCQSAFGDADTAAQPQYSQIDDPADYDAKPGGQGDGWPAERLLHRPGDRAHE
jgi:hypothetical protein